MFSWHNESINIWTHYIAAICIACFVSWTWFLSDADHSIAATSNVTAEDRFGGTDFSVWLLFTLALLGNALPIFLSAFCHQFYCISKQWHSLCWFLDFLGILTGMFCATVAFIYCAFYCSPLLMHTVLYGMVVAYILAIQGCWLRYRARTSAVVLAPADRFPEFSKILSTYGAVATAAPVVVAVLLHREYTAEPVFISILIKSITGPVLMALGIVCFAQGNFPERFARFWGVKDDFFDYLGHSHQWWHLLSASLQFMCVALNRRHLTARMHYGCASYR